MTQTQPQRISRREFSNYMWAASMAFVLAASGSLAYLYALPRPRDVFSRFALGQITVDDGEPLQFAIYGKHGAIVHTARGVCALSMICPHLGARTTWSGAQERYGRADGLFFCPAHGAQFERNGDYYAGPSARSMDRYPLQIAGRDGALTPFSTDDAPLPPDATSVLVRVDIETRGRANA
jgi:nitrite reductase/ring-hydroxylating ferredoxin subunit